MRSFTARDTSTVFEPGCLTISMMTASFPLRRAMVRRSATPSVTVAISLRRTCVPSTALRAMGNMPISSALLN